MRFRLTFKNILVLVAVLIITTVAIWFINKSRQVSPPSGTTNIVPSYYKDLKLGQSSEEDVKEKLGEPVDERQLDNGKILEYESKNPNFNNEVTIDSGKMSFVKEIVAPEDNISVTTMKNKYGIHKNVLYGEFSGVGFDLYSYPDKGIAYIGNSKTGDVIEIWYFTSTSFETFRDLYAKDYSEDPQPIQ